MDRNRDDILQNMESINKTIVENEERIQEIKTNLDDKTLSAEKITDLNIELQALEWENDEYRLDLGVLEEMLNVLRVNEMEDIRMAEDEYQPTYSSWDEVFTGGDY